MKKIILGLIMVLSLSSCVKDGQSKEVVGAFEVEFLFENEGCRVFRFNDGGHFVYYTDCRGNTTYSASYGKSTIEIQVANVGK